MKTRDLVEILQLEEVKGKLPEDKSTMFHVINKYQDLSELDKTIYRIGRRGGAYVTTDDLYRDHITYNKIKKLVAGLSAKGPHEIEKFINQMADQYV